MRTSFVIHKTLNGTGMEGAVVQFRDAGISVCSTNFMCWHKCVYFIHCAGYLDWEVYCGRKYRQAMWKSCASICSLIDSILHCVLIFMQLLSITDHVSIPEKLGIFRCLKVFKQIQDFTLTLYCLLGLWFQFWKMGTFVSFGAVKLLFAGILHLSRIVLCGRKSEGNLNLNRPLVTYYLELLDDQFQGAPKDRMSLCKWKIWIWEVHVHIHGWQQWL